MFKPFVTVISLLTASCALGGAWAAPISQGQTPATPLCIDTGHAKITKLCAAVVLRYKIDALLDVPMSNFGLNWTPVSWTITQPDGSARSVPHDHLPPTVSKALMAVTVQLKGTAMVDFSAATPLQFLQYQTNSALMQDKLAWTGASRAPVDKWLFSPGQCQDTNRQIMDPAKAMELYKLGVKSLSIDPRSSASICKAGTLVTNLDGAIKALDRFCHVDQTSVPGLCSGGKAMAEDKVPDALPNVVRWAAALDDGVAPQTSRPTAALLDDQPSTRLANGCSAEQASTTACAPFRTVSSAVNYPE